MIIKGGSRSGPSQLARHLQRLDTNDKVYVLELQSPVTDLAETFRDWQTLSEGTRGFKGLYHANIDPAQDYTMTPEQWRRAVDVLEKELKLEGQPRAVVMHEKFGREHIHVVWARTDIDEMVLRSDSQNYLAHERASQRLENEFGHEPVPGKHAKRDREQQPEFPSAEANQAEWQQGERTGIDPAARKDQITALKEACDNAQAFKVALEEQGYILAKGDRRDFVIVDETGSIHSLGRQIRDIKAAELREFMKGIDRETLPTAAQAKDLQQQRQEQLRQQEPAQQQPQQPEPSPAEPPPEPSAGSSSEPPPQQPQQQEPKEEEPHQPWEAKPADTPPEPASDPNQAQAEALRKALAERQAEEGRRLVESQRAEMDQLRQFLDRETREKLDRFDANHRAQTEALRREQKEATAGFAGFMDSVQDFFNPARAAERKAERQRELQQHAARLKQERDDYVTLIQKTNALEIHNREELHALRLHDLEVRGAEERDRYVREQELARKLQAENEERERQLAEQRATRRTKAHTMSGSRFLRPKLSRFFNEVARNVRPPISRFIVGAALSPPLPGILASRFLAKPPTPPAQPAINAGTPSSSRFLPPVMSRFVKPLTKVRVADIQVHDAHRRASAAIAGILLVAVLRKTADPAPAAPTGLAAKEAGRPEAVNPSNS